MYYDLKSIEDYLKYERSSVNLRYSVDWQSIVANCPFLSDSQVAYIYKLYDEAYNYNYHYRLKEKSKQQITKETIGQYKKLKELMFDSSKGYVNEEEYGIEYESLLQLLEKHTAKS